MALEGYHLHSENQLFFSKAIVSYSHLNRWLGQRGFKFGLMSESFQLGHSDFDSEEYNINLNAKARFTARLQQTNIGVNTEIRLKQYANYHIEYSQPVSLDSIIRDVGRFQGFLKLCVHSEVSITNFILRSPEYTRQMGKELYEIPITLYYGHRSNAPQKLPSIAARFILDYNVLKNEFGTYLKNWYEINETAQPVLDLLSDSYSKTMQSIENSFLDMTRAIEVFHRKFRLQTGRTEEIKSLIERLAKSEPKHKILIKNKLNYCHEPSLLDRLESLLNDIPPKMLFELEPKKSDFAKNVKSARNYLTHFDPYQKKKCDVSAENLSLLRNRIRFLLIVLLFREVKIDDEILYKEFECTRRMFFHWL
jgi:hypothetical protein